MDSPLSPSTAFTGPSPAPSGPIDDPMSGGLSFTPDQQIALFGGPAEPGTEYTITVRAGEPTDSGDLSFEVVASPDEGAAMPSAEAEGTPADDAEDAAEGESAGGSEKEEGYSEPGPSIGYDTQKARPKSKRISAKELEE